MRGSAPGATAPRPRQGGGGDGPVQAARQQGGERKGAGPARGLALLLAGLAVPAPVALPLALGLGAVPGRALAQAGPFDARSPVAGGPDNPGIGQDAGRDGLPVLRRNRLSDGPPRLGGAGEGGDASGGLSSGGFTPGGLSSGGLSSGATESGASTLDTRARTSGRAGGSAPGAGSTAPLSLVRQRAAPPRRLGTATKRFTQEVTQIRRRLDAADARFVSRPA